MPASAQGHPQIAKYQVSPAASARTAANQQNCRARPNSLALVGVSWATLPQCLQFKPAGSCLESGVAIDSVAGKFSGFA